MATKKKNEGGMSPLLLDLQSDLLKGRIEDDLLFANRTWRMHTLSDGEQVWAYGYMTMASTLAMMASKKVATLSAAISHINDEPVQVLFDLPEDEKLQEFLKDNPDELESYYRERMYAFLSPLPDGVIAQLYTFFESLEKRREEVISGLKAPSRETSSSESSNTSLPEVGHQVPGKTGTRGGSFGQ